MQKAGIIGCGWLGLSLAKYLISKSYHINGTSTSAERFIELREANINPFVFNLGERISDEFLEYLDFLIICFPISKKHSEDKYLNFIQDLSHQINEKTKVIFTSSISVYIQNQLIADEANGILDKTSINFIVEEMLQKQLKNDLTILRLGGLISENRHPIHFLAGKTNIENGNAPINLVHREDVIQLIWSIISESKFNEIFNCVYPFHPSKNSYYKKVAKERNFTPPSFVENQLNHKIVDGQKAAKKLEFRYNFQP